MLSTGGFVDATEPTRARIGEYDELAIVVQ
jgi:hypothetical protein